MAYNDGGRAPASLSEPKHLKRYLHEDAEDLRIIEEASKRIKTRRDERLASVDDDPGDIRLESRSSSDSSKPPATENEPGGSFELGRELDSPEKSKTVANLVRHEGSEGPALCSQAVHVCSLTNLDGSLNFFSAMNTFSASYAHHNVEVLFCGCCLDLPDDPVLTDCLHIYCAECFTELLVQAKGAGEGIVQCEVQECHHITNYITLSEPMFHMLANSVGLSLVNDAKDCKVVLLGGLGADQSTPVTDISGPELDDIAALWHVVKPGLADDQALVTPPYPHKPAVAKYQQLVNLAYQVNTSELDHDGLSDQDGRSMGYETPTENSALLDENSPHPFINDGDIKLPFYNSASEPSDQDDSNFSDKDSEISLAELPDVVSKSSFRLTDKAGVVEPPRALGFGGSDEFVDGDDESEEDGSMDQDQDSAGDDRAVNEDEIPMLRRSGRGWPGSKEKPVNLDMISD